ncbi:MAG: hypothetical protein ACFFCE_05875 [Promethearchaeota archaeon]
MSEKIWYKAAKIIVRASGNPLFQANETLLKILKTILNEEQIKFLLNFRKPILTYQELKQRLAPLFDYKRAKTNAQILKSKLESLFFWSSLTSQIAVIIYVTDLLDKNNKNKPRLIQANLRSLCNCSAYAFHRTYYKIGLTTSVVRKF